MASDRNRFEPDHLGIGELLKEQFLAQDLLRRGRNVASAVHRPMMSDGILPIRVVLSPSSTRVRVLVIADHPGALAAEAKTRPLGTAIDAAAN